MVTDQRVISIASVCHQANKAWCEAMGDRSQRDWADAEQWQRDSAINGVYNRLLNPDAPPSQSHENWMKEKEKDGWVFGHKKDPGKKEHPCMVPYDKLPFEDRVKDSIFTAIVDAITKQEGE